MYDLRYLFWPGGKARLAPLICDVAQASPSADPDGVFWDPFCGSGRVSLKAAARGFTVFASDMDHNVINVHNAVRNQPALVIAAVQAFNQMVLSRLGYYAVRNIANGLSWGTPEEDALRAGAFITLNRSSFNGLWRFNNDGGFNAPDGKHKRQHARHLDAVDIVNVSRALQNVRRFVPWGVYDAVEQVQPGDVVYMDPPYYPRTPSEFQAYGSASAAGDWGPEGQQRLADTARALRDIGAVVIASNHDLPEVKAIWEGFYFLQVTERDSINVKGSERGARRELLIVSEVLNTDVTVPEEVRNG